MKRLQLQPIARTYKNNGQHLEQVARYNLTGVVEKADNRKGESDVFDIQLKSSRATISNDIDFEKEIKESKSNQFGYISKDLVLYLMDKEEFTKFVEIFKTIDHDSKTKKIKIRLKHESKAMLDYLARG